MYQNNIAERSSSRVLQRPGGHQSINIFGGADTPSDEPQRTVSRGGRRVQKEITGNVGSAPIVPDQPKPSFTSHTSSIASVFNDTPTPSDPTPTKPLQSPYGSDITPPTTTSAPTTAPRVNNIWGEDDTQQRSSTRVLRGPGGGSSGVAGALGGAAPVEEVRRGGVARNNNATSANSPFSSEPEVKRSGTRVAQAPGGGSSGNILSWGH